LDGPEARRAALRTGAFLVDSGHLSEVVDFVLSSAFRNGLLPKTITAKNLPDYCRQLREAIDAETSARGVTRTSRGVHYESWAYLSKRLLEDIHRNADPILKSDPESSGFENPAYLDLFQRETQARFQGNTNVRLLVDGPASFLERERLIREAKKSIHILSWAFYDDVTGKRFADLFNQKKRDSIRSGNPVDIKVMINGLTSRTAPYKNKVDELEREGIEVIRWKSTDPLRRYDGQHRKAMIVDGETSIEGGMNIGDQYSHMGPPGSPRWRDTDVILSGAGPYESDRLFASLWNEQLDHRRDLSASFTRAVVAPASKTALPETGKVSLVNHVPGHGENILRANLLAIEAAKTSIDIENAYFILDPAIHEALLNAKARRVRVRILTNSVQSIDVPEMAYLIMRGVNQMVSEGFEVYLKKGTDTLHSKVMNVDQIYSWVGSYNFHPQSYRYEGEIIRIVLNRKFGSEVQAMLEKDFDAAERVTEPVLIPKSTISVLLHAWFYDQL
jgi:cardiolipin synthase